MTADNRFYVVGRTTEIAIAGPADASAQQVSPVNEIEHMLRLEWDAADAAAVLVNDGAAGHPEIWVGTVDCKDADAKKLETILRQREIDGTVRLFPIMSIPRGANGKVQRAQLREKGEKGRERGPTIRWRATRRAKPRKS